MTTKVTAEQSRRGNIASKRPLSHLVYGIVVGGLLLALSAGCGAPDAADADATFFAQQTAAAVNRPSPVASPTTAPTEPPEATPTLAITTPVPATAPTTTSATATASASASASASAEAGETATATVETSELPAVLSGSGTDVSDAVTLAAGVHVAQLTHAGSGNFVVKLLDASGAEVVELADGTGAWVGSRAIVVPATGDYVAEVTADGDWEIELDVRDPATSIVSDLPFEQSGAGSQALYFVRTTPGDHTLSATHDGSARFSVTVISSDGAYTAEVVATSGEVDQSESFTVPEPEATEGENPGIDVFLLIDIRASGNWTVSIE